ncbi:MAG TPA: carboxylesterase family protein [Caulobacteraceae bacterium]|nr:carboxylesterase family protein [Caulobacteraceae bacterium]
MNLRPTLALIGAVLLAPSFTAQAQSAAPIVRIASGALAGVRDGDVVSFKAIPYAAPPVGELRWRPPQPVKAWSGVRPADRVGAMCEQVYNARDNGVGPLPMSEDCLTLNVFAPAPAKGAPVMFWIHGGGFINGSGTADLYDGSALARQGVVVVTINYRLGRFGFFSHPSLTAAAGGEPVGNYGLMDMIAALKWTQANIGKFGGDPNKVTIFGESAGGFAVNDLMISPAAKGLFIRAIVESGAGRETAPPLAQAETLGTAFATKAGLTNATAAQLRALSAEQILKLGDPDLTAGGGSIADGKIMTMAPSAAFARGLEAKVPYIVGYNNLEFPVAAAALEQRLNGFATMTPAARERISALYPDKATYDAHIVSDVIFTEPALNLARLHVARGQPAFVYRFSVLSPSVAGRLQGAPHASERQYVFRTLKTSTWPTDANDEMQAAVMSAYWVAFAKTGDPNGGGRPVWPKYSPGTNEILEFTNTGPKVVKTPMAPGLDAIAALYGR